LRIEAVIGKLFSLELQMALLGAAEAFLALLWQFWRCKKIND